MKGRLQGLRSGLGNAEGVGKNQPVDADGPVGEGVRVRGLESEVVDAGLRGRAPDKVGDHIYPALRLLHEGGRHLGGPALDPRAVAGIRDLADDRVEDLARRSVCCAIHAKHEVGPFAHVHHFRAIGGLKDGWGRQDFGHIVVPGHKPEGDGPEPRVRRHDPDHSQAQPGDGLGEAVHADGEAAGGVFRIQPEGRGLLERIRRLKRPRSVDLAPVLLGQLLPEVAGASPHQPEGRLPQDQDGQQAKDEGGKPRPGSQSPSRYDAAQPKNGHDRQGPKARHQNELTNPPHPHV